MMTNSYALGSRRESEDGVEGKHELTPCDEPTVVLAFHLPSAPQPWLYYAIRHKSHAYPSRLELS